MSKFKVGDRVQRIKFRNFDSGDSLEVGEVRRVTEILKNGMVKVEGFSGENDEIYLRKLTKLELALK